SPVENTPYHLAILAFDHVLPAGLAVAIVSGTPGTVWLGRDLPPLFVPVLILVELTEIEKAALEQMTPFASIHPDGQSARRPPKVRPSATEGRAFKGGL
ncbi:MAG TPA: hypothetical protein VMN99_01725, partial [Anaerolineales bacterium]|nr:hypothetical protein [Anaerolineales bacterium]